MLRHEDAGLSITMLTPRDISAYRHYREPDSASDFAGPTNVILLEQDSRDQYSRQIA